MKEKPLTIHQLLSAVPTEICEKLWVQDALHHLKRQAAIVPRHKSTTHVERFMHFMKKDHPGLEQSAVTVFARKEGNDWFIAAARCMPDSQFSRRFGRQHARRRYFQKGKVNIGPEFKYELIRDLVVGL